MKRKNTIEKPMPLQMIDKIRQYNTGHGDMYKLIDKFRSMCIERGMYWNEKCYFPLTAIVELTRNISSLSKDSFLSIQNNNELFFHTYNWRQHKQIYRFDSEFANELFQSDSSAVDTSVFANLPYNSFFVELDKRIELDIYNSKHELAGFFCAYNAQVYDTNDTASCDFDLTECLHIMFVTTDAIVIGCPIKVQQGMTVQESLAFYLMQLDIALKNNDERAVYNAISDIVPELLNNAVQLLLYICSMNSDIAENPEQKKIYKAPTAHTVSKDRISEVRKWDVGYRIGKIIRESKKSDVEHKAHSSHSSSSAKRPHSRRGHFHHFWIGKRDSAERKLIVKWIAPMFINAKLNAEMPATITRIES